MKPTLQGSSHEINFNAHFIERRTMCSFQLLMENSTAGQLFLLPSHGPTSGGGTVKILAFGK